MASFFCVITWWWMEEFVVVDEVGKVSLKHKKKHEKYQCFSEKTPPNLSPVCAK